MTDSRSQPDPSIAALIRAAADGQLDAEQAAALEAHRAANPGECACIDHAIGCEKQLRSACGRVLSDCPPPSRKLYETVAAIAAQSRNQSRASTTGVETRAAETRERSFWAGFAAGPFVRSLGAVAALLLIGLTLFLFGSPVTDATAAHAREVARFVSGEHNRCELDPNAAAKKFDIAEIDRVPERYAGLTGRSLTLDDLLDTRAAGLRFLDAGTCHVPGSEASVHIRFETTTQPEGEQPSIISLFIQPDNGYLHLEEGKAYRLRAENASDKTVLTWARDGRRYTLVSDRPEPCPKVLSACGLPETPEQI